MSSEKQDLDRLGLTRTFAHDAASSPSPGAEHGPNGQDGRPVVHVAATSPEAPPEPGSLKDQRIGSYRVVRELGRGGMGVVYEVVHEQLGQRAVVKTLQPELSHNRSFNHFTTGACVRPPLQPTDGDMLTPPSGFDMIPLCRSLHLKR